MNVTDLDFDRWRARCAPDIHGTSPGIQRALDLVRRVAAYDVSVLLSGETGTGKELFARALHRASPRAAGPFVAVNCAAIPDALIESELFGHVRGAFTGAAAARSGRFAAAHGGTLFLDEIGDLSLDAQATLLRALETRTVCPVGADHDVAVDVRVVAATHRDLDEMVARGTFRADLYFRLSVVPIELPPLRARGADVSALAEAAIDRAVARGARRVTLDASARAALAEHPWPGNVRELNHVVERAVLLTDRTALSAADLGLGRAPPKPLALVPAPRPEAPVAAGSDLRGALEHLERQLIQEALARAGGNRTEAAALLGLNRTTLVEKLRRFG